MLTAVLQQGLTEHLPLGAGTPAPQFYLHLWIKMLAEGLGGKQTTDGWAPKRSRSTHFSTPFLQPSPRLPQTTLPTAAHTQGFSVPVPHYQFFCQEEEEDIII